MISRLAYSGLPAQADIEVRRKVFLVNLFCVIGLLYLLIFGISAAFNGHSQLATVVLGCAGLALGNFFYLRRVGNYLMSGHIVATIVTAVFIYLLCTGGVDNTGPLWCYVAVPLILFQYGSRTGLVLITALALFSMLVLFVPDNPFLQTDYSMVFKTRFMGSFVAVIIMSLIHEYAREESYTRMLAAQRLADRDARTDHLTGLANRRHMFERIEVIRLESLKRKRNMSMLLCDIDHFKQVNDTHGHHFGDEVLTEVARVFTETLRGEDLVSRWGGEEFLVLLPCTEGNTAHTLAEKLRERVAGLDLQTAAGRVRISMSIGVQEYDHAQSVDQNIMRADHNLYLAKQRGRNCVVGST